MPDVIIPDKDEFKIGEVCEIAGVKPFVLRYWETEFPELSPSKGSGGQRTYSKADVQLILRIKQLLYEERFTVAGAKKRLSEEQEQPRKPSKARAAHAEAAAVREPAPEPTERPAQAPPSPDVDKLRRVVSEAKKELEAVLALLS